MIVLINAISIKEGGSLVVLQNLLLHMIKLDDSIRWHVAAHGSIADLEVFSHPRVTGHFFSNIGHSPLHVQWWYNVTLPGLVRHIGADLLFSQTNYLPLRKLACPTLLLEQHAGHFSDIFDQRMQASLSTISRWIWRAKRRWIIRSLQQASAVTVQTAALADAIAGAAGIERRGIHVIPHGCGLARTISPLRSCQENRPWHIGYITKFGVQKNFEVLIEAARILKQRGDIDFRLHLTLNPGLPECQSILAKVEAVGIGDVVINHGELSQDQVPGLYDQLDLFVFPSLCESFGFPLLEAMAHSLPLLIADVPGNREVAGSDAPRFSPYNAAELADKLVGLTDSERYVALSQAMRQRSERYNWFEAAQKTLRLVRGMVAEVSKES
ncbi:glycosyltransferase [Mariprofundus sp. KV]|uniref:glycosyltransferase n=1 Tax=Mariprofundus sp. KV TaxID=2608715 RepID=UPI0015A1C988|nr:glycosyltransferase [Mariprofundus sp. KV]